MVNISKFTYNQTFKQNCFQPKGDKIIGTTVVVLAFFSILLAAGLVIIVAFIFYSLQLVKFIISAQVSEKKHKAKQLIFLAASSSLSLLAQCFYIVVQAVQVWEWSPIAIITFMVIFDLNTLLLFLHYAHNTYVTLRGRIEKIPAHTEKSPQREKPIQMEKLSEKKKSRRLSNPYKLAKPLQVY